MCPPCMTVSLACKLLRKRVCGSWVPSVDRKAWPFAAIHSVGMRYICAVLYDTDIAPEVTLLWTRVLGCSVGAGRLNRVCLQPV